MSATMKSNHFVVALVLSSSLQCLGYAEEADDVLGRWDITVRESHREFPSWLEVRKSGHSTLVGTFVGEFGSARPVSQIKTLETGYSFSIPPQWEQRNDAMPFQFTIVDDQLIGKTTNKQGEKVAWTAKRAPSLSRSSEPTWGQPIELFNGTSLDGWKTQLAGVPNGWVVENGYLYNKYPGNNLLTEQQFVDFKLRAEFRYPKGSNSGIYLRGRYEVQIEDNFGGPAECHKIGGVYGFLTPSINAAKPAGEWQSYEITLIGRSVTLLLNGERVVDRQAIPGITGGALNSDEGAPGPILIQGDHGPIEFRKLTLTPANYLPESAN